MLYKPEMHEPLADEPWDEGAVRAAIRAIVADVDAAYDADRLWPADEWDGWRMPLPLKNLYIGASGVIWALARLRERGLAETALDLGAAIRRTHELWRETPDFQDGEIQPPQRAASLLCGEAGILVVAWSLERDAELANALLARVRENGDNEADELMWGVPGTLLAARAMLDWTGDEPWADAWGESAEQLWSRRNPDGTWTQRLWGESFRGLGPAHGLAGNVLALLGGGTLLAPGRRDALMHDAAAALAASAVVEDGLANWPVNVGDSLVAEDGEIRVAWDYGAAGIVTSATSYLDEKLLLAGGELTWRAGPPGLEKGPGICHGTAGNGYAFLKLLDRTGDVRWLERARRFAVHALAQVERLRTKRRRGRYSLWTGDVGPALFAADCLAASTAYPVVDSWDW